MPIDRRPCEDAENNWQDAFTNQGMPKIANNPSMLGGPSEASMSAHNLTLALNLPHCKGVSVCCLRHPVFGVLSQQPGKPLQSLLF